MMRSERMLRSEKMMRSERMLRRPREGGLSVRWADDGRLRLEPFVRIADELRPLRPGLSVRSPDAPLARRPWRLCSFSALAACLLLAVAPVAARADDARREPSERGEAEALAPGDRPWQRGVSEAQRQAAERELAAGNELFERSEYSAAVERYRAALAAWAHPAIQFNLAVCLIYLDRPVEAYDLVQAALRFGREALPDHFDEAHNYERLLRDRIATLEVVLPAGMAGAAAAGGSSNRADNSAGNGAGNAIVTLDGARLAAAPGEAMVRLRLAPGRHSLVARRPRFETWSKDLVLPPGEVTREVIVLRAPRTRTVRRWSSAMPWWVAGSGGAAMALGAASLLLGNANLRAVTAEVTQQCPPPAGCPAGLPSGLRADRDRAVLEQRLGAGLLVAGGAAVVTGVVLLVLNQPRQVLDVAGGGGLALQLTPQQLGVGWSRAF